MASSSGGQESESRMDKELLKAATSGNSASMQAMTAPDPSVLLATTPAGNNCLHIAATHGYEGFCMDVLASAVSLHNGETLLLSAVNLEGETPLLAAVKSGCVSLASNLLPRYAAGGLTEAILTADTNGSNALHHAIRNGHSELALTLIAAAPALSRKVNTLNESPMFIAAMRDYTDVSARLLEIDGSAHSGPQRYNALHATARNGNSDLARLIMGTRPRMASEADGGGHTPLSAAVYRGQIGMVRVLLEHDRSLGYEARDDCKPLLSQAASGGHIDVAQELLSHCPDAPFRDKKHPCPTSLHEAVDSDHVEFVKFIVRTPQLGKLINMQDVHGKTALHVALQKCNPKMVAALLSHQDIDTTVLDDRGNASAWGLLYVDHPKTLNWNEVRMRMLRADPQDATSLYNLQMRTKQKATEKARKDAKSLTQTYTSNTSLVAILMTTITFAAAFTLPGGYSGAEGSEGLPIMSRNAAFKAFLVFDTLAMCSSFAIAFICIIARWEDYEFLVYYRSFTKKLMWFAYVATTTAFSTGLYTVLAPRVHWLAIAICVLAATLPILTWVLGSLPVLKLRIRLGKTFNSDLLDMV